VPMVSICANRETRAADLFARSRGRVLDHGQNREARGTGVETMRSLVCRKPRAYSHPAKKQSNEKELGEPDGGYGSYPCMKSVGNHGRTIPGDF